MRNRAQLKEELLPRWHLGKLQKLLPHASNAAHNDIGSYSGLCVTVRWYFCLFGGEHALDGVVGSQSQMAQALIRDSCSTEGAETTTDANPPYSQLSIPYRA